jgi:orotate phosphoribosyltransferase
MSNKLPLLDFVREYGFLTAEPGETFTLASGQQSDIYFDARRASLASGFRLIEVSRAMANLVSPEVVALGAVPTGGLLLLAPILMQASMHLERLGVPEPRALQGFYVREEQKRYGRRNWIEGALDLAPPGPVALIEDTVSTAQSVIRAVELLRGQGREVREVICLVNRRLGGEERLRELGVPLKAVFTVEDLEGTVQAA